MSELADDDLIELILVRLTVNDLIRFKRVCKSWYSLITSPNFITRHLNRHKHRHKNQIGHRRILLLDHDPRLVGSANGLVCISLYNCRLLVGNPVSKQVRHLAIRPIGVYIGVPVCWGFSYDSVRDDYKVIVGSKKGETHTCVYVLSLKSDVWKVVGEVKGVFIGKVGVLCNGALHWIILDENNNNNNNNNNNKLIISYDLSKEEFKEIPQPDDASYEYSCYLGIIEDCLCMWSYYSSDIWLMRKYNVTQSWELLPRNLEMKYDVVNYLTLLKDCFLPRSFFYHDESWFSRTLEYICTPRNNIGAPLFMKTLVSPFF